MGSQQDTQPLRGFHAEEIVVAGRFLCNGAYSAGANLPEANYVSGKGYRVRQIAVGRYRIYPSPRSGTSEGPGFRVLSLVGTVAAPDGTVAHLRVDSGLSDSGGATGMDFRIYDASAAALDLSSASSINFVMVVQRSRLPEK